MLKANHQKEIYEGRVQTARQREGSLTAENRKLRQLIEDMLYDRAVFNSFWSKTSKRLKDRRKFLLDMIERSSQAFNQGAETLDNYKKLQSRRVTDRNFHISEMVKMDRQIDANRIMNVFLGQKGKRLEMAELELREVNRREMFKDEYSNRLNLYHSIIQNIKNFTSMEDVNKAVNHYQREENDGFQVYKFLNEINQQIELVKNNNFKLNTEILGSQDYNKRKLKFFDQKIEDLHKKLHKEIEKTLKLKGERDKFESQIDKYMETVLEILKILRCDLSPVQNLLGDHKKVTVFNVHEFFSLLEHRLNEVLSFVYCDQRKYIDILTEDPKLIVKSIKRVQDDPVRIEDVITTQQCAECAEGGDVNRNDETIVYMLDYDTIRSNMRSKIVAPEMAYRLHNLSKCNLPRSGVIASRRYNE